MRKYIGGHLASAMEGLRTLPLVALIVGSVSVAIGRALDFVELSPRRRS